MVAREEPRGTEFDADRDVMRETFDALRSLGHSESDARRLIEASLEREEEIQNRGRNAAGDLSAESQEIDAERRDHRTMPSPQNDCRTCDHRRSVGACLRELRFAGR